MNDDLSVARDPRKRISGQALLDREIPEDYLAERTLQISATRTRIEVGTKSVVIFRVSNEWFGLPTKVVQEVEDYSTPHSIPHHRNGFLNGVITVRGELVISLSLESLLRIEGTAVSYKVSSPVQKRALICGTKGNRIAFPVNEVHGVYRYHPSNLRNVPATLGKACIGNFLIGVLPWQKRTVGCLDDSLLFYEVDKRLS